MLTERDLQELEQAARWIVNVIERHRVIEENADERRRLFRFIGRKEEEKKEETRGIFKFTKKEIENMPLYYKNLFFHGDVVAHWRRRSDDLIEIRCQIDKKRITASAKTKAEAAKKFLQKLNNLSQNEIQENVITFFEYASKWLETVKKPMIKPRTYEYYLSLFRSYLFPLFGEKKLTEIKQFDVQDFLNGLVEEGKTRTAQKHLQALRSLFEYAVADDLIAKSPMRLVKLPYHEEEHGSALTYAEEREFVGRCLAAETRTAQAFVFILYTGLRRSELATAKIENGFVVVTNAKQRKGRKEKTRSIPIAPRLAKLLPNVEEALASFKDLYPNRFARTLKEWLPNHHLHDLRHTFITRCQECGISRELTSVWAGHKADNTMTSNVYTHFSNEYQKREMKKFDYEFTPNFTPNF